MTSPLVLPSPKEVGWGDKLNKALQTVNSKADQANAAKAASPAVLRRLSEFTGSTDDQRLAAAASYGAAQTYRGMTVMLDELREYKFLQPITAYSGFSIQGPGRQVDQARSSLPIPNKVTLSMPGGGGWLRLPNGNVYGVNLDGISFDGSQTTRVFEPNPSAVLWFSTFNNISMQNLASLIGAKAQFQPVDFLMMSGSWNLNNIRECAWHVGGSDCFFKPTGMNLDTIPTSLADTEFLTYWSSFGVAVVEGLYITAEEHSAMLIKFSNEGQFRISNCNIEGRNPTHPCFGSLIRIEGGDVLLRDNVTHYAMSNPSATGRNDAGVIHITGGNVLIDGCQYRRAASVAETVPYIYVSGGKVRVQNIMTSGNDTWSDKPRVAVSASGTGVVTHDDSVTQVSVA